ncbi:hypothetical protein F943_01486 [Acinetobacter ursingii NIPH 706]|uniref:phage tail protein n=1 Tax=Acinetobacter ursingii TaxID=108980 RepID=UPI0002CDE47E|nr:phage tail protein [Acinetobacter ursingii]ENX49093.1 hypothetical protein F943_01486 [Acinetobacter ursingii NIPH 706]
MADQIYYSVFTKKGLELLTEAIQNGTKLGITSMAFGDGGGSLPVPNEAFTQLVNEVHRTQLNSLAPDPNNANWLRAEAIIASAVGGFNIRELGLYAGDVLVAYSNYPATYKPNPSDGTARIMTFRMVLQIDNTSNFDLVIDPDVVLATIQKVEDAKLEIYQNTVSVVESVADLVSLDKWDGRTVKTKSYYTANQKGAATYIYDPTKQAINNTITIHNGWCLQNYQTMTTIDCFVAGFKSDASDETVRAHQCYDLGLLVCIPDQVTIAISVDSELETKWAYGLGRIKWLNFTTTTDMERIVPSCVQNYPSKTDTYQQIQYAKVSGALGGKNVGRRMECNPSRTNNYTFNNMSNLVNYGGADIIGDMVAITDLPVVTYSNVKYTATTAQCDLWINNDSITTGDYIRAGTNILGVVYSLDKTTGTITLSDGWGNVDTKELNVTPTNDLQCNTPVAYRMWGRNDYVTARANNSTIYNILGYELDIVAGHTLSDICGFFPVAFGTNSCVAAFRTGRGTQKWWYGLHCPANTVGAGLYVQSGATYAVQHGANYTVDSVTVYSSQAYKGMRITYAKELGVHIDNTPVGIHSDSNDISLRMVNTSRIGISCESNSSPNTTIIKNTSSDGNLIESSVNGFGTFKLSMLGQANRTMTVVTTISSSPTSALTRDSATGMLLINGSTTNVNLSASFNQGEIIEVKSLLATNVTINDAAGNTLATLNTSAKSYARLMFNSGAWYSLFTL